MTLNSKRQRLALALASMEAFGLLLEEMPPDMQLDAGLVSLIWRATSAQMYATIAEFLPLDHLRNRNDNPAPLDRARPPT